MPGYTSYVFGCVAEYLLWIYVWFYVAWGLNYSQPDIYQRIGMERPGISKKALKEFAQEYIGAINGSYVNITASNQGAVNDTIINGYKEMVVEEACSGVSLGINHPFNTEAHAKSMLFSPLSSMAGITGSMGPFFCEFTINADVQPHEYPATCAHEYAHFLGITDEGEANFYSYVVCTSSRDKAVRFSGYYLILFHVLANVRNILGQEELQALINNIRPEIIRLAQNDREYWQKRRSAVIDGIQNYFYNLYLKGNNVEGGTKSYSGVTAIILAWNAHRAMTGKPAAQTQKRPMP